MTSRTPNAAPRPGGDHSRQRPDTAAPPSGHARSDEMPSGPPTPQESGTEPSRRPWGARRTPAGLAAALILLAAGALLFETVWQHTGHRATPWWRSLTDQLATRPVDDVWILCGAALAAALGLWLVILALTPGLRPQLPLRVPTDGHGRMRAALNRKGAALLLRDTALRVPGVSAARVRVHRRRVTLRADVGFRETDDVRDELTAALRRAEHEQLVLARLPRLTVRIRRNAA
ncbi:DUF6286 domain-containing protein [Streptomyces cucumeris]|uniref:DUF6286 domain-containing protein n=1 Tax=Streptomyces cucumeris TaxID=2962890 RepID=UPI003D71989B